MSQASEIRTPARASFGVALALVASLALLAAIPVARAADTVVDTIQIQAGPQAHEPGHVALNGKYKLVITGQARRQLDADFSVNDALYCFQSSAPDSPCSAPGGHPTDVALSFVLQTGSTPPDFGNLKPTLSFADPMPIPTLSGGHSYEFTFSASGGTTLHAVSWPDFFPTQGESLTGSFTIEIRQAGSSKHEKAAVKCKRTIAKSSADYFATRLDALADCEVKKRTHKLPVDIDCRLETKTRDRITKATSALEKAIDKACGGDDKVCGGDLTDETSVAEMGFGAKCPGFHGGCTNDLTDCSSVAQCLLCVDTAVVTEAMALYGAVGNADPESQKQLNKCQQTVVKAAAAHSAARLSLLQKCQDGLLKIKASGGACANEELSGLTKAEAKMHDAICKACGGREEKGCGGPDDFTAAQIAFPATCPDAVEPLDIICAPVNTTATDVVNCSLCKALDGGRCAAAIAVPSLGTYPDGCE